MVIDSPINEKPFIMEKPNEEEPKKNEPSSLVIEMCEDVPDKFLEESVPDKVFEESVPDKIICEEKVEVAEEPSLVN